MKARQSLQRLNAAREVVARRIESAERSRREVRAAMARTSPGWIVAAGVSLGALFGQLPMRGVAAAMGAIAGFSLRLMTTPLGSVAAAIVSGRGKKNTTGSADDTRAGA
jgi:hypothetical protein